MRRPWLLAFMALGLCFAGPAGTGSADAAHPFQYGDVVRIAPNTLLVAGRPLDAEKGEADIGNAILYRPRRTLYVIDTGATPSFRPFLRKAIKELRPFNKLVLINTHGHPDHIGNDALVTGLNVTSVRHYMSRKDFPVADHYLKVSLAKAFKRVSGYIPGFDHPVAQARDLYSLFDPVEQSRWTRRAIEALPGQRIKIGNLRTRGWVFGNDDVEVIRSGAHTPGELIVYFPRTRLLHMSDELVSYYPAFPEADADGTRRVFGEALKAAHGGAVRRLTDGHTFTVYRGPGHVRKHVRSFIYGYDAYSRVVKSILRAAGPTGATVSEIIDGVADAPAMRRAPGGPNPGGPLFGALQALKKLQQLHALSDGGPRATRRFHLPH